MCQALCREFTRHVASFSLPTTHLSPRTDEDPEAQRTRVTLSGAELGRGQGLGGPDERPCGPQHPMKVWAVLGQSWATWGWTGISSLC